nr:hypothetical protein CFP56_24146 [Quercus suber]
MFLQSIVEDILRIKLGEEQDRDKLRWKETKNGCFSVKTAYRVTLCLNQPENSLNTPLQVKIRNSGKRCGSSLFHEYLTVRQHLLGI